MRCIDIYEFRDMFHDARSAAVVGNSSSITAWENGEFIDSHDMVVRFNRAYTDGLEEKIGSRTDVLVSNVINNLALAPSPAETLRPKCVIVFARPKLGLDTRDLKEWIGDVPYVLTLSPDIYGIANIERSSRLTIGSYALYTMLRLFNFENLFITGFTMLGVGPGGGEKYYHGKVDIGKAHDLAQEARIFSSMVRQFRGKLQMTPEVETLIEQNSPYCRESLKKESKVKVKLFQLVSSYFLKLGFYFRRKAEKNGWLYLNSPGHNKMKGKR